MTTGFCANFIKLNGGSGFNESTVFVGNVNLKAKFVKKIVDINNVGHHPYYNPKDRLNTSGFDIGYVLVDLIISLDFV